MPKTHQVALCRKLRNTVRVLHDAWIDNASQHNDFMAILQSVEGQEIGVAPPTASTAEEQQAEQQRFWELHRTISTVSATTPSFEDSASVRKSPRSCRATT